MRRTPPTTRTSELRAVRNLVVVGLLFLVLLSLPGSLGLLLLGSLYAANPFLALVVGFLMVGLAPLLALLGYGFVYRPLAAGSPRQALLPLELVAAVSLLFVLPPVLTFLAVRGLVQFMAALAAFLILLPGMTLLAAAVRLNRALTGAGPRRPGDEGGG